MEKDLKRSWSYHWHCLRSITSDHPDGVLLFNSLRLWSSQFLDHTSLVRFFLSLVHFYRLVLLVNHFCSFSYLLFDFLLRSLRRLYSPFIYTLGKEE